MFAQCFIVGLCLCVPAALLHGNLAISLGWEAAVSWPLLSGLTIAVSALVVGFSSRARPKEAWAGLLLGIFIGSGAIWFLQLFGR